ncbi:MAG: DNA polymerase III subunit beta [Candidatus Paceibacterota bacterium]|jgi:DNA polymerase-3 subunit beta|nr:DNA polymerase III subunit beta [Candidatus Paceibacterota bacterium]
MKLECSKDVLKNAVGLAERMVGKNLSLPVLGGILFSAKNNKLLLRATNLDVGIEMEIPAQVSEEGTLVIQGNLLSGVLSSIYDQKVSLETSSENMVLKSSNGRSVLKCLPHEDFPTLPVVSGTDAFAMPVDKFVDGVKSVWYSASISDMKPEIASVCIYSEGENIIFAATDSFRLAEKKVFLKEKTSFKHVLIPQKNIVEILRVFDGVTGSVNINVSKNQISFSLADKDIYVTSRIVDGIFPDYQQIIPKDYATEATVLKQDIMNALKVTNLFSDKFNRVDVSVDVSGKKFITESKNSTAGENMTVVDASLSGKNISCGFNQKYLIDCFQSLKQDSITFRFSGEGRPLVIRGVSDQSFMYLVMPLTT